MTFMTRSTPFNCAALAGLMLVGIIVPGPAATAQTISALKDHNSEQPIDIAADEALVEDRKNQATLTGNVRVTQGDLTLMADKLVVYYATTEGATNPTISRLDALGGVALVSPSERVSSNWGVYDVERRIITLGDDVTVTRGDSVIEGNRMELDLQSGVTRIDGATGEGETRVRARFSVPKSPPD